MSRESKIIAMTPNFAVSVKQLEAFGWELFSIADRWIVLSRETQNPVYDELVAHEKKCDSKLNELLSLHAPLEPKPIKKPLCVLLFCLLVFPGVLYLRYKKAEKAKYDAALAAHTQRTDELSDEIKHITEESRSIFFAKQG